MFACEEHGCDGCMQPIDEGVYECDTCGIQYQYMDEMDY